MHANIYPILLKIARGAHIFRKILITLYWNFKKMNLLTDFKCDKNSLKFTQIAVSPPKKLSNTVILHPSSDVHVYIPTLPNQLISEYW